MKKEMLPDKLDIENHADDAARQGDDAPKSRDDWVTEIIQAHTKTAESILQLGLTLTAAKNALEYGEWLKMFDQKEVPVTITVAQKLMKIAADHRLRDAAQLQLLPTKWATMYELTKLPDQKLKAAIEDGTINPKMKHKDAKALVKAPKRKAKQPPSAVELSGEEMDEQNDIEIDSDYRLRVEQAIAFAKIPYKGKVTNEIIDLARGVVNAWDELGQRFRGLNHIRLPRRVCKTRCG